MLTIAGGVVLGWLAIKALRFVVWLCVVLVGIGQACLAPEEEEREPILAEFTDEG